MHEHQEIYKEIVDAPALPTDLFAGIELRIRQNSTRRRIRSALVATFVGAAGVLGVTFHLHSKSHLMNPDVVTELQNIHNYLNASDIEDEMQLYAVIDTY